MRKRRLLTEVCVFHGDIKVGVGKGYDGHVVKGISKTAIFEKNDALPS